MTIINGIIDVIRIFDFNFQTVNTHLRKTDNDVFTNFFTLN